MSEPFPLFDHDEPSEVELAAMTDSQRGRLRAAFADLKLPTAAAQFDLVEQLTGRRIRSPLELNSAEAQALLVQLRFRVEQSGRTRTGNAWDDREEDTWIDRL